MYIAETMIVCAVAFAPTIISSLIFFGDGTNPRTLYNNAQVVYAFSHEIPAVALLWWVLARRRQSLSSWLLPVRAKDIGHAIILIISGSLAYYASYYLLYGLGLTSRDTHQQFHAVSQHLFGARIASGQLAFAVFNPFYEELIVRAYLMTMVKLLTGSIQKAILVSVLVQTSYHLYQGGAGAMSLSMAFLIYSIYYARTSRIQAPLIAHMYQDVYAVVWVMLTT